MGGSYNVNKKGVTKQELPSDQEKNCNSFSKRSIKTLPNDLKQFWDVDSYVTLPQHHLLSLTPEEKHSLNILETTTSLKDGYFKLGLLWQVEHPQLPFSRKLTLKRFEYLEKKFTKNPEFAKIYKQQITEYIALGHARKLSENETATTTSITNYIPHHGVTNVNKPGKARVVFDASGKFKNKLLNEHLLPGLDLISNLVSVLLRFRKGKYAVMADIQNMFYQVNVCSKDVDAMRFRLQRQSRTTY